MRRGLITRNPRGGWTPTRAGWSASLPPFHFVLVNGREREVELREDGAFLYGESAAYPLNRRILATALGVRPEQLQPAERGVLITGSVTVHVR